MQDHTKQHLLKIIDLLYNECKRSGGDGDAIWFIKYYKLEDIIPLVEEYNSKLKFPFTFQKISDKTINWGDNQEWVTFTTDEEIYNNLPGWEQMVIKN